MTTAATATVAAYDASAAAYAAASAALPERVAELLDRFVTALPAGARVLEIGSGPGRDALVLERAGLSVRRTDITPAFVELLRAGGYDADVVDPLVDDLTEPGQPITTYDGVWASACLLHVDRADLPTVLTRLAAVTRVDGVLHLSVKEGDGERWSTHGSVTAPRRFVFWREAPLRAALEDAGWTVLEVGGARGSRDDRWIDVLARRTGTAP